MFLSYFIRYLKLCEKCDGLLCMSSPKKKMEVRDWERGSQEAGHQFWFQVSWFQWVILSGFIFYNQLFRRYITKQICSFLKKKKKKGGIYCAFSENLSNIWRLHAPPAQFCALNCCNTGWPDDCMNVWHLGAVLITEILCENYIQQIMSNIRFW